MPNRKRLTVVETPEFLSQAEGLWSDEERRLLIDYLALNPTAGDVIRGTGGVRKLRWGIEGRGKRSGSRVIYFFHNDRMPVFLLTAYSKSRQEDLSQADRNSLREVIEHLVKAYRRLCHGGHR